VRDAPEWLVPDDEPHTDADLGTLRSGKEAQVDLVERTSEEDGRTCLLVRKRYLPRQVSQKGELEALGVQRASAFRNDSVYRAGRRFRSSRDARAVERGSRHGRQVLRASWFGAEHEVLGRLWEAGAPVPYPVGHHGNELLLEYVGDRDQAAPQLAGARLRGAALASAWEQLVGALRTMTEAGVIHADLSAYNLLWWHGRLWVIDLP